MNTTKRSAAALLAVMMLFIAGCSKSDSAAKTSTDTESISETEVATDTVVTDDTVDSGDLTDDTGFTEDSALTDDTGAVDSEFCDEVDAIKSITADIQAASTSGDIDQIKAAVASGAEEFQKIAEIAPAELKADAEYVAQAWDEYSTAVSAVDVNDPASQAALKEALTKFQTANDGDEVKNLDAYFSSECGAS